MTQLTIFRGLPGSGKSSEARNLVADTPNTVIVERDILRLENPRLEGEEVFYYENKITKLQHTKIKGLLGLGVNVISSDTNLRDKYVKPLLKLAHEAGAEVVWRDFRGLPLETALLYNAGRVDKEPVPEEYIRAAHAKYIKGRDLTAQPEYVAPAATKWKQYIQPVGAYGAWLVDIDGTLASKHPDRDIYDGSLAHMDNVHEDVAELVRVLSSNGHTIIIMTGRGAEHREVTVAWLNANNIPWDAIHTRPAGDSRRDDVVKHELFWEHVAPENYRIAGVLDDRNQVVEMWRGMGLTCFQVAEGNF